MGGSCYRGENRDMLEIGSWCENSCFSAFGGCEGSMTGLVTKPTTNCEYRPTQPDRQPIDMALVNQQIEQRIAADRELFLYTPDMFQPFYLEGCLNKLPNRNGRTYLAINACVRSFLDSGVQFADLRKRGIREMWIGVESGDPNLRERYDKPTFINREVVALTKAGKAAGVHVCWFLVDGREDTDSSRLATYELIRQGEPYRIQISTLQ